MTQTFAALDEILKEDYKALLRKQFYTATVTYAQLSRNSDDIVGREAVLTLHVSRNSGTGGRKEMKTLPKAGRQGYKTSKVSLVSNYGRIELSGHVIRKVRSDRAAVIRALKSEMKGIRNDVRNSLGRQTFNRGTKDMAQCAVSGPSTTVQLDTGTYKSQMKHFIVGMQVDIGTTANYQGVVGGATVTAVDIANRTITIDVAVTTAASDYVFNYNVEGEELTGLRALINDTGVVCGVDPAVVDLWKSAVDDNGGVPRSFTDTLLINVLDEIDINHGEAPDLCVVSHAGRTAYFSQFQGRQQFPTIDLKGGFKGLSVSVGTTDLSLTVDRECPTDEAYLINTSKMTEYVDSTWEWMSEDGAILNRIPDVDGYEATLYVDHELATDTRNAHGVIRDLSV